MGRSWFFVDFMGNWQILGENGQIGGKREISEQENGQIGENGKYRNGQTGKLGKTGDRGRSPLRGRIL